MRTFLQNKLWRDKTVETTEKRDGSKVHWRRLDDKEFDEQIRLKLCEETEEAIAAQSREELITEIADVYEVISALSEVNNITEEEIIAQQIKKRDECGGFDGRKFVEKSQHHIGSYGEKYCLSNPKKYIEIKVEP